MKKLKSRKLWVTVAAAAIVTLGTELGIDPSIVDKIVNLAVGYLLAQGAVDAVTAAKQPAAAAP